MLLSLISVECTCKFFVLALCVYIIFTIITFTLESQIFYFLFSLRYIYFQFIFSICTIFNSSEGLFLMITKLLYSVCRTKINYEINIVKMWPNHSFINTDCCFLRNKVPDFFIRCIILKYSRIYNSLNIQMFNQLSLFPKSK